MGYGGEEYLLRSSYDGKVHGKCCSLAVVSELCVEGLSK